MDKIPQVYQQRNTFYYKVNINGHRVTRKVLNPVEMSMIRPPNVTQSRN